MPLEPIRYELFPEKCSNEMLTFFSLGNRNFLKKLTDSFPQSSDQLLKSLKSSLKICNFLVNDQSEGSVVILSILIGQ